jgi:hypothetical protein
MLLALLGLASAVVNEETVAFVWSLVIELVEA